MEVLGGCLDLQDYQPWVNKIERVVQLISILNCILNFSLSTYIVLSYVD